VTLSVASTWVGVNVMRTATSDSNNSHLADPFDFLIVGGTGDLAKRKLLPALYLRDRAGQLTDSTRIIGISKTSCDQNSYRQIASEALKLYVPPEDVTPEALDRFLRRLHFFNILEKETFSSLHSLLNYFPDRVRAFYLATPPDIFGQICRSIDAAGLTTPKSRVVIEKPVGLDGVSSRQVNEAIGSVFPEDRIYRVDHYLGKETVQNLMVLRFANILFEPVWNSEYVDHVQITVAEILGIEGRSDYYNSVGALRDMVQNHILQLLCLVAMEQPSDLRPDSLRGEKLKVLKSLKPIHPGDVNDLTVRGQYEAGDCQSIGYREEVGLQDSSTETFVALKAEIDNQRWSGVPFYLRTGKRLSTRISEIIVTFKAVTQFMLDYSEGKLDNNRLVIRLQPDGGIKLLLTVRDPRSGGRRLHRVPLCTSFADVFGKKSQEAHERILMDVVRGDQTLFMRREEVETSWHWIDPIIEGWKRFPSGLKFYPTGTWGPDASTALIERDKRMWYEKTIHLDETI